MYKYFIISSMIVIMFASPANSQVLLIKDLDSENRNYKREDSEKNGKIKLSLSDAIALGLRNNREIKSAYLERISQKYDLRVAEDSFSPKLIISGDYLYGTNEKSEYKQNNIGPTANLLTPYGTRFSLGWAYQNRRGEGRELFSNDGANIQVIQPLLRDAGLDVTTAPRELSRLTDAQNRLTLKATISHKITEIANSYRDFFKSEEIIKITDDSLRRAKNLEQVNESLIKAGRMAEIEIVQTQAEVANQELALEEAKNNSEKYRLALLQLLAIDPRTPLSVMSPLKPDYTEINVSKALKEAKNTQPAYLRQMIENKKADINVLLAKNGQLWDISLVAGASQVRSRSEGVGINKSWDQYIGIKVEVPVGNLIPEQATLNARISQKIKKILTEEMEQQLYRDVSNAAFEINTRWRQYEISIRAYNLTLKKFHIEKEKLLVGRSTNFQLINYEHDLRNAESARLNASINYQNELTEVDEVIGTTLQSWGISLKD